MDYQELTATAVEVVQSTIAELPDEIRTLAANVPVHYESLPDDTVLAEGFEPDILGLFTGSPHGTELQHSDPMPAQILLYLDNIRALAEQDRVDFRDEVRVTYLHELGHYFGWDEDDLADRGLD